MLPISERKGQGSGGAAPPVGPSNVFHPVMVDDVFASTSNPLTKGFSQTINITTMSNIANYEGQFVAAGPGGYTYFVENGKLRIMNPLPADYKWEMFPLSFNDQSVSGWPVGLPWDWNTGAPKAAGANATPATTAAVKLPMSHTPIIMGVVFASAGGGYYLMNKSIGISKGLIITGAAAAVGVVAGIIWDKMKKSA